MTSLLDYKLITNEVFYRCWHIIDYIEAHPDMKPLEREAIQATIMEALVSKKLIDPEKQSLDLSTLSIVDDKNHYCYEKHPRICGIPLWMKEKFRGRSLYIIGGEPISLRLSRPPSKFNQTCVYDPNIAVSSIFDDATFYNTIYDSPTREGVRLEETRPFVEVEIDGVKYLVDVLTKRILRSDWFKKDYNMEITYEKTISKCSKKEKKLYNRQIEPHICLAELIPLVGHITESNRPELAEYCYELELTKKYFPEEWERAEKIKREMEMFRKDGISLFLKKQNKKEDK